MDDTIFMRNMTFNGVHGADPHEYAAQPFRIEAELEVDLSAAWENGLPGVRIYRTDLDTNRHG